MLNEVICVCSFGPRYSSSNVGAISSKENVGGIASLTSGIRAVAGGSSRIHEALLPLTSAGQNRKLARLVEGNSGRI